MQKLLDFDLAIEPLGDGYRARVVKSPAGEARVDFALPFNDKDLEILILKIVGSVGRVRRKVRRIESEERRLLEEFGDRLFQAAFSGSIRECLGRSRLTAENKNAGLRIRLRLPPELANVPWEYLYDAEYGFLGLSPETALVRYVEMPNLVRPFPISPPLRVLTMISTPSDVPGLQDEEEWEKLNKALSGLNRRGMVQIDRLEVGTLSALQRSLRLHNYHVLHFIGHGIYDEDAQDGALALEGAGGKTRLVTGRDLGLMIRGHRSLRLVVLNACEGARSARDDPFGGVAQVLVRQGIPAVIAMQFEISDPAALVFSQSFYEAIADGLPVDAAVVEARRAMFAEGHEVEWATPVLYLRSPDGRVFTKGRVPDAERHAAEDARPRVADKRVRSPLRTDQSTREGRDTQPASQRPDLNVISSRQRGSSEAYTRYVPVLGQAGVNEPLLATRGDLEYLPLPDQYAHRDDIFAVKVKGDSMAEDGVLDGDFVLVAPDPEPEDGAMVLVLLDDLEAEAIVRRVWREGANIRLEAANAALEPIILGADVHPMIQGKVIGVTRLVSDRRRRRKP